MRKYILFYTVMSLLFTSCELPPPSEKVSQKKDIFEKIEVNYPESYQDTTIKDNFHGKIVADPYRWLEGENSQDTRRWVKKQNDATFGYLNKLPNRNLIKKRLEEVWNYERLTAPFKRGDNYYFFKNDGLQNQSVLYEQAALNAPAQVVLDPNQFSKDGTASLGTYSFSKDGSLLAYQVSEGGSDWRTIFVKDLQNNQMLSDTVQWVKFSEIEWAGDGFFYSRYPSPQDGSELSAANEFHQVYFHRVGTSQSKDDLIYADRTNAKLGFAAQTTSDERFLIVSVWESTSGNALFFKDLENETSGFTPIISEIQDDFVLIDNVGDNLLFLTNNGASNWRLIQVNASQPNAGFWEEIIPENRDVLRNVQLLGGRIVANYLHKASSQIRIFKLDGTFEAEIELPEIGTVSNITGSKDDTEAFFEFSSYRRPTTIYQLDLNTLAPSIFKTPQIPFDAEKYETKQIWYQSYDGTKIPMFLTHQKGLKLDGKRPTLLYGYGGFDISILPRFDVKTTVLLENGGIYAVANIRGGGEFGRDWHLAGTKDRKQNVFNDFQAAAEYLISNGLTSKEKLAIEGRSNGGLLVGACITQRPDLYQVAFPGVGVMDMLRYHQFTIGAAWAGDYGRSDDPESFDYLIAYSPVHNVEPGNYPATLITTADHDDRVVPAHSFKFAAALQANQKGINPTLIRIETSAGHGAGKPTSKRIEESADMLSFMFYNMKESVKYSVEN